MKGRLINRHQGMDPYAPSLQASYEEAAGPLQSFDEPALFETLGQSDGPYCRGAQNAFVVGRGWQGAPRLGLCCPRRCLWCCPRKLPRRRRSSTCPLCICAGPQGGRPSPRHQRLCATCGFRAAAKLARRDQGAFAGTGAPPPGIAAGACAAEMHMSCRLPISLLNNTLPALSAADDGAGGPGGQRARRHKRATIGRRRPVAWHPLLAPAVTLACRARQQAASSRWWPRC
jgi:hypothetical protein